MGIYGCHQCLCPQGELQLPPASPGSAPGSDPSSFQMTTSALGSRTCEILCEPFKSGVCFPQPSGSPESKPRWPSKPNILGAHLPGAGPLGQGTQCGAWTPHSLRRDFAIVIIPLFVGYPPRVWVLTIAHLCPSYLSRCGSFFISLVVEDLFY